MKEKQHTRSFYQQFTPIHSSKPLAWRGIQIERYLLSPGCVTVQQGLSSHLLMVYLGEPSLIVQTGSTSVRDTFMRKGEHAFVPAEGKLEGKWPMDVDALFLRFEPAFIRSLLEAADIEAIRIELLPHTFLSDQAVERFSLALLNEVHSSGFKTRLYAESLATAFAIHLLRYYSTLEVRELKVTSDLNKIRLRQIIDYVHTYYTRDLSIAELAGVANVSPSHFAQLFKQTMGMAPHEYLLACRVEHAKQLLMTSNISIHEIASQCGFADQSHLTRHFRHIIGVTPGALRKDQRNIL